MMEFGLIGEKLGHSFSPQIHRCFGDYDYRLCPLSRQDMEALVRSRQFRGLNVTIPYKQAVLPLCDEISDTARAVGSANTLVMRDGRLTAYNTDLSGFLLMLDRAGIALAGKKAVILGSGGTSLTAQAACRARQAREAVVVSRHGQVTYDDLYARHTDADVLINATPVGMYPNNLASPVDLGRFSRLSGVADVIYNPARTALLMDAEERGIPCVGGLWMLAAQGWYAARLFLGRDIPEDRLAQAYRAVRRQTLNLVLVGMPGSGKSTLGRLAAERLGRQFVDLDAEIEKTQGPIPAIFARQGEAAFRDMESQTVRRFGRESALVIATGGGAVLRKENVRALRQNAVVAWIRRPAEQLNMEGRPLSADMEALLRMEQQRTPLYRAAADFDVQNDAAPQQALERILEGFDACACDERAQSEHVGHS